MSTTLHLYSLEAPIVEVKSSRPSLWCQRLIIAVCPSEVSTSAPPDTSILSVSATDDDRSRQFSTVSSQYHNATVYTLDTTVYVDSPIIIRYPISFKTPLLPLCHMAQ